MNPNNFVLPHRYHLSRSMKIGLSIGICLVAILVVLLAIRLFHRGRLLPGTSAYGIYLGGMTKDEAINLLTRETQQYSDNAKLVVNAKGQPAVTVTAKSLSVQYNPSAAVQALYEAGRQGPIWQQLGDEIDLMTGSYTLSYVPATYDPKALYEALTPITSALNQASVNASLALVEGKVVIEPEKSGARVDLSQLASDAAMVFNNLDRSAITVQTVPAQIAVTAADLHSANNTNQFPTTPLTVSDANKTWQIPASEVLAWYGSSISAVPIRTDPMLGFYAKPASAQTGLRLNQIKIAASLTRIAAQIDQPGRDAKLTFSGERATVFQQSQDGRVVDIGSSAQAIATALDKSPNPDQIALVVKVTKANVNDENIDQLGIHDLLSEGVTYFPGSSANRLTNVRVGQALYNNYLLKPDQIFSFGEILGPVGPEQGYKPGLIILANHEEQAYGGGLCQVSSTAYRAALLAGLPIVERVNHAFAVNFYTAPFGVPGVDATIYYPQVDFKFKNDTGHYILIQTEMVGTTLKFRFYGTKSKSGVIRGPNFIYGSNNPNQPSQTVFYRDILDLSGKVIKTDTYKTTYKSALEFPVAD